MLLYKVEAHRFKLFHKDFATDLLSADAYTPLYLNRIPYPHLPHLYPFAVFFGHIADKLPEIHPLGGAVVEEYPLVVQRYVNRQRF